MKKLLSTVFLLATALSIAGCASTPYEDVDDHPWNDSIDMRFGDPGSMDEDW